MVFSKQFRAQWWANARKALAALPEEALQALWRRDVRRLLGRGFGSRRAALRSAGR